MQAINSANKKYARCFGRALSGHSECEHPGRVIISPDAKLLVRREEAAQLLSISQRGLDYLIANRRLPTRRIGGRVLIPVADLRKCARGDHPERIVV
ncbi:MAG TPA: helix-turn-helix domain-containing protein [Terracidiphilus sp.]|jgi:excisionase family DNA binding protein